MIKWHSTCGRMVVGVYWPFCALSCSITCLLQLQSLSAIRASSWTSPLALPEGGRSHDSRSTAGLQVVGTSSWARNCGSHLLPTRKERIALREPISVFPLGGHPPGQPCDGCNDETKYHSVGLPVLRLAVPTASGRPDVFRVRDFAASTHLGDRSRYRMGNTADVGIRWGSRIEQNGMSSRSKSIEVQ